MFRNIMIFIVGILMISLTGCNLKTPEIRGVVLDAETKQPVEGAWVTAKLEVYSKTVGGEVHHSLLLGKSWTDKKGKFLLPSKEFKSEGGAWSGENKTPFLVKRVDFFRNDYFLKCCFFYPLQDRRFQSKINKKQGNCRKSLQL